MASKIENGTELAVMFGVVRLTASQKRWMEKQVNKRIKPRNKLGNVWIMRRGKKRLQ